MADAQPDDLSYILQLFLERTTTLSIRVEILTGLLEARGVFTAAEFDQQTADLRARWELPQHYHWALSQELTTEDFVARLRRVLVKPAADDQPTADAS